MNITCFPDEKSEWHGIPESLLVNLGLPRFSGCLLNHMEMQKLQETVIKTKS